MAEAQARGMVAVNPDTGEAVYFDRTANEWRPAKTAVNPQTKEMMAYDGVSGWQKITTHGHGILSYVDDAVRAIASGMTFGYADEFAAKANQLVGKGTYESNLARERERDTEIPAAIKIPGEIAGGVASTVAAAPFTAAAGAVTGLSKLPFAAKLIAGGAGAGALYGSGEADSGLANRLTGAAVGAGVGAVAGGVVAGASNVASHVLSPVSRANAELGRAIGRDDATLDDIVQAAKKIATERPDATLADVGGENVKGLLERVAQTPGAGRTTAVPFLTARQTQQIDRVADDLSTLTGTKKTAFDAVKTTMAERQSEAGPLYDAAMNFNARENPEIVKAWTEATSTGWGKSILNSGTLKRNLQSEYGISDTSVAPLMVQIDAWKKAADDAIGAAVRQGNNNVARTIADTRDGVLDIVRQANPKYAEALSAWAGKSRYLQAIEDGKDILSSKLGSEELAAKFSSLGESEKEAFRIGAVSAIKSKMGNDPAKLADMTKYLRAPEVREKIAAIMPTKEAAQRWEARLNFEVGSSEMVGRSLGNSATARRLAEMKDSNIVTDLVADAFTGTPGVSLVKKLFAGTFGSIRDTIRSRTDRELASVLTRPDAMAAFRQRMQAMQAQRALGPNPTAAAATVGAVGGINALTGPR